MKKEFALKGIVIHTPTSKEIEYYEDAYVVCDNGKCGGIFKKLPSKYGDITVIDYSNQFIMPGMSDLHMHASQYGFRAIGMLMDPNPKGKNWFDRYSLPEEGHFSDEAYAKRAYLRFTEDLLKKSTTTRAVIFATIHRKSTEILMDLLEDTGLYAYVGKLNMDRNSPPALLEATDESISETKQWIVETKDKYRRVKPMITPRYLPACTDACLEGIGKLAKTYKVPVQSHMSADTSEIEWVKRLKPDIECYGDAYDQFGLLGNGTPAVMAHVVYPTEKEYEMLSSRDVWVAHCPRSNTNAVNGIAPVRKMLDRGIKVGLASDVGSNFTLNLLQEIANAVQMSKMRWRCIENKENPVLERNYLTLSEAFYMATKGGGSFFGNVGSFEKGYEFDAVVINDESLKDLVDRPLDDRLQRILWLSGGEHIMAKYVAGQQVYQL